MHGSDRDDYRRPLVRIGIVLLVVGLFTTIDAVVERCSALPAGTWDELESRVRWIALAAMALQLPMLIVGKPKAPKPAKDRTFSLVQLLIVVGILAALVAVSIPFPQGNCGESPITKAKQDLDTLRNAIHLQESRIAPLQGDDLRQLVGKTMQDLPDDPWGLPYRLDTSTGIVYTLGADHVPGGDGSDRDIFLRYR